MTSLSSSSSPSPPLSALAIFKNILNQELIRSVHLYGEEERLVEREFIFSPTSCIEIRAGSLIPLCSQRIKFDEGETVGLWLCVFAFDSTNLSRSAPLSIPSFLCFLRNPSLKSVPTLADDLQKVYQLMFRPNTEKPVNFGSKETCPEKLEDEASLTVMHKTSFSVKQQKGENQPNDQLVSEIGLHLKKKRAATDLVASISLEELAMYFNLPITEASKHLNVGLTVLKRKCREFGIPRWPHRKIKSLDTLIQDLQEEVSRQQKDNEVIAVRAATRRQQMLEREKKGIERSPIMELQRETKRFRQDVFKRRHKAKALSKLVSQS